MRHFPPIAAALGIVLALAGCSRPEDTDAMSPTPEPAAVSVEDIAGQEWIVDSLRPSKANAFDWSGRGISLQLDATAGRASGYGGCNRWFAGYTSSGPGQLSFSQAGATRMACMEPEGVMEREQEFLDALGKVSTFRLSEDHLYLESDDDASGIVLIRDDD